MGSRIMHYCISARLAKELKIDDDQFFLGGIAPDVNKNMKTPKTISHFVRTNNEEQIFADYLGFHEKYLRYMREPFYLGYFYHLISDVIWVEEIYYKKIKWLPQPDKKEAQLKYYRDFWRLNGKLIDYYSIEYRPMEVKSIEIEEIDYRYLPEIIKDLENDFAMKDEAKEQELEILEFEEVIDILERTVKECVEISMKT
ncbi:hypothetical protein M4D81_08320 [Paenibacillus sp. p3-SID867]|uniref:hypothetical protein n=1 Tax=Paenibacillus sp. p3-SID867 TaxID=2916363 RepID=UPI0021A5E186|nr:hypothetical protein [Paenibacillus sp. p3-SID867]MCT1399018.1 hypothetical protein [Paenibacillus sp. p3-SID867]